MKFIYFLTFIVIFFSCTSEEERQEYTIIIRNDSGSLLDLEGYDAQDILTFQSQLNNLDSSQECIYLSASFGGLSCRIDSLVVRFDNGKGYICDERQNENDICFANKYILGGGTIDSFTDLGNNRYEFVITEEDFINAHDLPE